ncbi:hypothetical protein PQJ75_11810 [Rhodoplanes sp. TEM]|uniref:CN hydrolase domain-containing protein n=1 Tax=Rhodoplanes tepidamans TaxID=200616 RepID=A0ABT5JGI2_RHOTP|nr:MULTISPECIES: hypothetical protein [Rhodoplanes]MDC7788684.1 hypothetical protein [Rhodoplanes tepidamans]MDC7984418.1 hypothetical protein [Rhodoplanes sp. TEM]MDQ0358312.1 hypothetical protein [Rhodoplanes tepidamans]
MVDFTVELIKEAQQDTGAIHGVLFPEYALDWSTFEALKNRVLDEFPKLEFLVSGSSSNCGNQKGNFALSAVFLDIELREADAAGSPRTARTCFVGSRSKHHPWRIDEPQVSNYALGSTLDPRAVWWEATPLGPREIKFNVFRSSSAFTTLICEDLARSDPCHAVLRDVGPNLVFVMLMDGPQLKSRWSARYSTTLADDPGCSVLKYTSLGLIERANDTAMYDRSRVVALWKDDTGKSVEVQCPAGAHGVVLTLSDCRVVEETLDGRRTNAARAWRFHSQHPITLRPRTAEQRDMLSRVLSDGAVPTPAASVAARGAATSTRGRTRARKAAPR